MRVIIHVMMLVHFLQKFGPRVNYHPDHHHLTSQNRTHSSQESGSCVRGGVQATGAGSEVGEPGQQYSPLLNCSWCPGAAGTCDNRVVFFVTSTARLLSRWHTLSSSCVIPVCGPARVPNLSVGDRAFLVAVAMDTVCIVAAV